MRMKAWLALLIALLVTQGLHAESTPYPTVTDERLQHPDPGDWLMYRQNGIDKIRGTTTAVPKAGTVLVFKLR